MVKKYRYFGGFLNSQEKWLNDMAKKGYRLIKVGKLLYEFEACLPGQYQYALEFIAEKSKNEASQYKDFLEGCGYTVFYKNINLSYSVGKVRFRPWAKGSGKLATGSTTYNRELFIVEKQNDGKPFELHTTAKDKIEYLEKWRNIWFTYFAMFALMSILFVGFSILASIILGAIGLVILLPLIMYQAKIIKMKKEADMEE
ncbi:MAG: DUF2812 domain-containing protein [Clostridia bacterium]|nr:DUF2812 domain-containing protein [Clostridia bacterium]